MQRPTAEARSSTQRDVTIQRDGVRLSATFWLPAGSPPFPCVVFVHGRGSSKDSPRNVVIAAHLVDAGIAALLFDLSGHGDSSDDPRDGAAFVDDVTAVFAWAQAQPELDAGRIGVAGSSLGAVIATDATRSARIRPTTMVFRAPPVDREGFSGLDVPSLAIVGSLDPLFKSVREAAGQSHAVTLSVVSGAGHLFDEPGALEQALERTVSWFEGRLRSPERKQATS